MESSTKTRVGPADVLSPRSLVVRRSILAERNTLRVVSIVVLIGIWEIISLFVDPLFLPGPWSVAKSLESLTVHGGIWGATVTSVRVFIIGYVVASAVGIALGVLLGLVRVLASFADLWLTIMWATPSVALIPLLIIWFGITDRTQLAVVFLSTFFPVVVATSVAVENVDSSLIRVARAFGGRRSEVIRFVVMPSAVPYIVSGLRIAVGRAVIGVIVAELLVSSTGLGAKMSQYGSYFQTANYFAAVIIFIIFSVIVTEAVSIVEKRFSRWKV